MNFDQRADLLDLYNDQGFVQFQEIISTEKDLIDVEEELTALGKHFFGPQFNLNLPIEPVSREKISAFYDSLRYSISLTKLSTNSKILALVKELGLEHPIGMNQDNIRMDEPTRDEVLFHWHQDITYLLGSKNSVTLWIPLGKTDLFHGTIGVKPIKEKKIYDFEVVNPEAIKKTNSLSPKDIVLSESVDISDEIAIEANRGDVIAFSQYLLHRSRSNRSNLCRWTIQLRYSDLLEPNFVLSGMPMGDRQTILNCQYYGDFKFTLADNPIESLRAQKF
jgi:hypothetical protein